MNTYKHIIAFLFLINTLQSQCQPGFLEINDLCFYEQDINVIQKMIDNSYQSGIDLGCQDGDIYCGSPNPFMDTDDFWGWVAYDGIAYKILGNYNGIVEPLELGIQEWENGRLTSLMCGAYIYCQLSGEIPSSISDLTEIEVLRLEVNYFSGYVPDSICELDNLNYNDYLAFDLSYNQLCPPYPDCIPDSAVNYMQTEDCAEIGDINLDGSINVLDVVMLVSSILEGASLPEGDINGDSATNVLDVVMLVSMILEGI